MTVRSNRLRIAIVAEHASAQFGGEAALPLHYFRVLRSRNIDVRLVVHERTREELNDLFGPDPSITYITETPLARLLWRLGGYLPLRVASFTTGFVMRMETQVRQRTIIKSFVRDGLIDLVHQPMPVSPREPSLLFGLGVPVVIGPMNGNMSLPPAFRKLESLSGRAAVAILRVLSLGLNRLLPGKPNSAVLVVANQRTRRALPKSKHARIVELAENGVDLDIWMSDQSEERHTHLASTTTEVPVVKLVYSGRLVEWKAVDHLLVAFSMAAEQSPLALTVIGDGVERESLEDMAVELGIFGTDEGIAGKVYFTGWLSQRECADVLRRASGFVLPSLMECGGAVVLEAMAMGLPVIATNWGGPADYLNPYCGILVDPGSPASFAGGLAAAMSSLAASEELRDSMGCAGRSRVVAQFDWERKVDRMLAIYEAAADRPIT